MIILVVLLVYIALQKTVLNPASGRYENMLKTVDYINQSCPVMINDYTRLDSIVLISDNKEIVYFHTELNMIKDSIDIEHYESLMKHLLFLNALQNPDLRAFRVNNMTISNSYNDNDGIFLCKVSIQSEIYKNPANFIEDKEYLEVHLE